MGAGLAIVSFLLCAGGSHVVMGCHRLAARRHLLIGEATCRVEREPSQALESRDHACKWLLGHSAIFRASQSLSGTSRPSSEALATATVAVYKSSMPGSSRM